MFFNFWGGRSQYVKLQEKIPKKLENTWEPFEETCFFFNYLKIECIFNLDLLGNLSPFPRHLPE